ncbi:hypothetical protein ES703_99307 [subsurface metagenome]
MVNTMTAQQIIGVTIIIDKTTREEEGRQCFWRNVSKDRMIEVAKRRCEFSFVSLSEYVEKGKNPIPDIFNIEKTQVVIVNWDVLNGDLLYDSDKAFHIFQHFLPEIDIWVKLGGIMLVECQEGSRRLRQEVYDLFGNELAYPLTIQEKEDFGERVHINKDLKKSHPLLEELSLDDYVVANSGMYGHIRLYPANKSSESIRSTFENARWNRKIYVGWFDDKRSHQEWEALIFARGKEFGKKRPIMMCRTVQGETGSIGAYIITSMFIGSSGWLQLTENILGFCGESARNAHNLFGLRKQAKRKKRALLTFFGVIGAASLLGIGFFYPGEFGPILGAVVVGIGTVAYQWAKRYIERGI